MIACRQGGARENAPLAPQHQNYISSNSAQRKCRRHLILLD